LFEDFLIFKNIFIDSGSTSSGLSTAAIVGIVVGGTVAVIIAVSLIAYACYSFGQHHTPFNRAGDYRI
jgi:hypothetical protein